MKLNKSISLILRLVVAIIFIQTLYFKFTAHPDSVHIFSALGLEPYGRIGLGLVELVASILILVPRTKLIGVVLSLGIIVGAIGSHFVVLGTEVQEDGGGLFALAIIVFVCCLLLIFIHREELMKLKSKLLSNE